VLPNSSAVPQGKGLTAYLLEDNWNDWYKYRTLYTLVIAGTNGEMHHIGGVKIGEFSMPKERDRPDLPRTFTELEDGFFSLGQDDSYYESLNQLGTDVREAVLRGLRDAALDLELFGRALKEEVTSESLLRSITTDTVRTQFHRQALGGARLSRFDFGYESPIRQRGKGVRLDFTVVPHAQPPTNIHVLIGRNGVGKTTMLNDIARAVVEEDADPTMVGTFVVNGARKREEERPTGLVSVSFSAFDLYDPLPEIKGGTESVQYSYIGLKQNRSRSEDQAQPPKSPGALADEFGNSVVECLQGARVARWRRALEKLEADPIFRDAAVAELAGSDESRDRLREKAMAVFKKLSSGHKIVLLTTTRLVETVGERTLVLFDEPEGYLHPPLLSAFIRALSDLLIDRNGVAIVATHSPVVLQEVPRSCVWKIRRTGAHTQAERPEVETFGENVGVLTREVFGLEVTETGFHRMLREAVRETPDFDEVVERFNSELGGEARALLRAMIAARSARTDRADDA
jgi:predicted ATPase